MRYTISRDINNNQERTILLKYKTQDTLRDWQHHADEMQELTKHADSKTNNKNTITAILTSINAERLLGCKVKKVGKQKMVSSTTTPTPLMPALVQALGDNVTSLPELISTYYSNVAQRADYVAALKIGLTNMVAIDSITGAHRAPKMPTPAQRLLHVNGKMDIYRDDKRIFADVARAVSLALFNQLTGQQLTTMAGRGLYLTRDVIRQCMTRPTEATDEQISNSLTLLRICNYLHIAQADELTDAGKKLATTYDAQGKAIASHRVYFVGDFAAVNWEQITRNFHLNLNTRIGRTVLVQFLGLDVVRNYFPDLSAGVSQPTINFMVQRANASGDNRPIMSLKAASDTVQSIDGVTEATARKYVDQVLVCKGVNASKMTTREALDSGYDLDSWKSGSPAEKLIVPTTQYALLLCIERLKRANAQGVKVAELRAKQLLDD